MTRARLTVRWPRMAAVVPLALGLLGLSLALIVRPGHSVASGPPQPGLGHVYHGRPLDQWSEPPLATAQNVHGTDDRVNVTDTTALPFRLIAFLGIYNSKGDFTAFCTGTFIGPDSILTAAHCLYDVETKTWSASMRVVPGRNGSTEPYGYDWASDWWVPDGWISTGGAAEWDWGIIKLPNSTLNQKVGNQWFIIAAFTTATLSDPHFQPAIIGYPGDKTTGTMWGDIREQFYSVGDSVLTYEIDTFGGESGSAVFSANLDKPFGLKIAGIHVRGGSQRNEATRISAPLIKDLDQGCKQMGCTFQYFIEPGVPTGPSTPTPTATPTPTPPPAQSLTITGFNVCKATGDCTADQVLDVGGLAFFRFALSAVPTGHVTAHATLNGQAWDVSWDPPYVGPVFNTGTVLSPLNAPGLLHLEVYADSRLVGTLVYPVTRSLPRRAFVPQVAIGR